MQCFPNILFPATLEQTGYDKQLLVLHNSCIKLVTAGVMWWQRRQLLHIPEVLLEGDLCRGELMEVLFKTVTTINSFRPHEDIKPFLIIFVVFVLE